MKAKSIKNRLIIEVDDKIGIDTEILTAIKKGLNSGINLILPEKKLSIELLIIGVDQIHLLNKQHRNIDRPTDVLSFPNIQFDHGRISDNNLSLVDITHGRLFIGSIVICSDIAYLQAQEYGHSPKREFSFLAVHSLLHLLGWDHELNPNEEKEQYMLQDKILTSCNIIR